MLDMHVLDYFKDHTVRVLYEKQTMKEEEKTTVLDHIEGIFKDYDDVFLRLEKKKKHSITVKEPGFWGTREVPKDIWKPYSVLIRIKTIHEIAEVPNME